MNSAEPSESRELPGSGTIEVTTPSYDDTNVRSLYVSVLGVSDPKNDGESQAESAGADECLSDADRQALLSGLQATSKKIENCDGISDKWNVIEKALMKNPRMMRNLKRLQDMGAELVVTEFREGQYVEFADAAVNLDIQKQEGALAGLAFAERDDAIEQILQPLSDNQKEPARTWILSQLRRLNTSRGLNWTEALVLAVAHGGTLTAYEAYDAMVRKDLRVYESMTWTWYLKNLSDVMRNGCAPRGFRYGGKATREDERDADHRYFNQGVRVAGLRVPIA